MKKIHIAIAVLATATLISCQQERSFDNVTVGENEIAFVLQSNATRASEDVSSVSQGAVVNLGQVAENLDLFLEETISDLNGVLPQTRGIPIYTENVGTVYKDKLVVNVPGIGDAAYESMDTKRTYAHDKFDESEDPELGWRYRHNYKTSPWPDDNTAVDFYLRMPDDMTSNGVTFPETGAFTGGKTKFTYLSPTTAAGQEDIIFTYASMTRPVHKKYLPNGYPVTFYHALTGVKFAINNALTNGTLEMGIQVTGISFKGLKNTGTCTVDAGASAVADKIDWNPVSATSATNVISQTFVAADNVVTYDEKLFPESFFKNRSTTGNQDANGNYEKTNGAEINHAGDASYTFWLIPQDFTNSDATIIIQYKMNGIDETKEIPLKKIVKGAWAAGQLRTYTFKLNDVNLKIEDNVSTSGNASDAYTGSVKSNVVITNTGNTDAYIRAAIVGQWLSAIQDANTNVGDIVFGFTDAVGRLDIVESWYQDQFGETGDHEHGEFVGLAGYKNSGTTGNTTGANPYNGWVLCKDGYYYYTEPVAPNATTATLFDSYTTKSAPTPTYGGKVWSPDHIYFTLEISTQAISANDADKLDGSNYAWDVAWEKATTVKPVKK